MKVARRVCSCSPRYSPVPKSDWHEHTATMGKSSGLILHRTAEDAARELPKLRLEDAQPADLGARDSLRAAVVTVSPAPMVAQ